MKKLKKTTIAIKCQKNRKKIILFDEKKKNYENNIKDKIN